MTNEAVLMREVSIPISGTVVDGAGILKGTLLTQSDPNTVAASTTTAPIAAGIASQEKVVDNGQTKLAYYDRGDFRVIASGNIGLGDPLAIAGLQGLNYVYSIINAGGSLSGNIILGHAREAATDEETFRMELHPQTLIDPRA